MSERRSRIPSPSRSHGAVTPRRRPRRSSGSQSVGSTSRPLRLSTLAQRLNVDAMSPLPARRSVLADNTVIDEPRRRSWWNNLADKSSNVMSVVGNNENHNINDMMEDSDVEVNSQEEKYDTLDLPESSGSESFASIIIPEKHLFTLKQKSQRRFTAISRTLHKTIESEKTIALKASPKKLFKKTLKRSRPQFPDALLNISTLTNKTNIDKTIEVKPPPLRTLLDRDPVKRKNMFQDFIVAESDSDVSDVEPRVFGFQKHTQATLQAKPYSPSSTIASDVDTNWDLLPSSTMVEGLNDIEQETLRKRPRFSKISNTTVKTKSRLDLEVEYVETEEFQLQKQAFSKHDKILTENVKEINTLNISKHSKTVLRDNLEMEEFINENDNSSTGTVQDKDQTIKHINDKVEDNEENNKIKNIDLKNNDDNPGNTNLEKWKNKSSIDVKELNDDELNNEDFKKENVMEQDSDEAINDVLADESSHVVDSDDEKDKNEVSIANNSDQSDNNEIVDVNDKLVDQESDEEIEEQNEDDVIDEIKDNEQSVVTKKDEQNGINSDQQNEVDAENNENQDQSKNQIDVRGENNQDKENLKVFINQSKPEIENKDECKNENKIESEQKEYDIKSKDENNFESDQEVEINNECEKENEIENAEAEMNNESGDKNKIESDQDVEMNNESENEIGIEEAKINNESGDENKIDSDQEVEMNNESEDETKIESEVEMNDESENDDEVMNKTEIEMNNKSEDDTKIESEVEINNESENGDEIMNNESEEENKIESDVEINDESKNEDNIMNKTEIEGGQEVEINDDSEDENKIESDEEIENNHENEDESKIDSEQEVEMNDESENETIKETEVESEQEVEINDESEKRDETEIESEQEVDMNNESDNQDEIANKNETTDDESANIADDSGNIPKDNNDVESVNIINDESLNIAEDNNDDDIANITNDSADIGDENNDDSSNIGDNNNDDSANIGDDNNYDSANITNDNNDVSVNIGDDNNDDSADITNDNNDNSANIGDDNNDDSANISDDDNEAQSYENNEFEVENTELSTTENIVVNHKAPKTSQATLISFLKKIKQKNLEKQEKISNLVMAAIESKPKFDNRKDIYKPKDTYKSKDIVYRPKAKPVIQEMKPKKTKPKFSTEILATLPKTFYDDMKYKPPKRYTPPNTSWATKRLYNFLETKLKPRYDIMARIRAEKLVGSLFEFSKEIKKMAAAPRETILKLQHTMARLKIVETYDEFYDFFNNYLPKEIRNKVIPDLVNKLPLPPRGVYSKIIPDN